MWFLLIILSSVSYWGVFIFRQAIGSVIESLIGCCAKEVGVVSNVKSNGKFGDSTLPSIDISTEILFTLKEYLFLLILFRIFSSVITRMYSWL